MHVEVAITRVVKWQNRYDELWLMESRTGGGSMTFSLSFRATGVGRNFTLIGAGVIGWNRAKPGTNPAS